MADEPKDRQDEAPAEKPAADKPRKAKAKAKPKEKAAPKTEAKPKPARRARRKKATADEASEPVVADEVSEPGAADPSQVAASAETEAGAADPPGSEPDPSAAEPAAKRAGARRSRTKKADEQAATAARSAPARSRGADAGVPPVVRAHAKYVRTSARKARLVCDHIRGRSVAEARAILLHTNRQVAEDWSKLLESAVANAEHNHELIGDDLRIAFVRADEGPTLKRFRPRAMGRATKIRKRTSHLSIGLEPKR